MENEKLPSTESKNNIVECRYMWWFLFPQSTKSHSSEYFHRQSRREIVHLCWYSLLINLSNSIIYMIPFQFAFVHDEHRNKSIFDLTNYKCFRSNCCYIWYWIFIDFKIITNLILFQFYIKNDTNANDDFERDYNNKWKTSTRSEAKSRRF